MFQEILNFWYTEITPAQWWKKDADFDLNIKERFSDIHRQANACELSSWRATPNGRLAEIIVLDQFSRNIYRDTPKSFASDPLALALAQEAIANDADKMLSDSEKSFLYMPYMHSESPSIHVDAAALYSNAGLQANYEFELKHKEIIDQFGRYPHRNQILGRESTEEELTFLKQPGSSF